MAAPQQHRPKEGRHFGALDADCWDPKGQLGDGLHRLNRCGLRYLRDP